MSRMIKKQIYRIEFQLVSPMAIGSGDGSVSDKDIIVDGRGVPYIPGSSIAGVCRGVLENGDTSEGIKEVLGYVEIAKDSNDKVSAKDSNIIFYDACLFWKDAEDSTREKLQSKIRQYMSIRDSVALDDYKTADKGKKFDMQVLEPCDSFYFVTYIEQSFFDEKDQNLAEVFADLFQKNLLRFGAKTMRGYGQIACREIKEVCFDFREGSSSEYGKSWADFDMFNEDCWKDSAAINNLNVDNANEEKVNSRSITLELKLKSGISIRKYTTKVAEENKTAPDYEQLTIRAGDVVIPGTSWAGAFRHHMLLLSGKNIDTKDDIWRNCFGYVDSDKSKSKSKIQFSESRIKVRDSEGDPDGAIPKVISRNAINRFTGGTVDGALYTEKTYFGGTTTLTIGLAKEYTMPDELKKALAATITDLHYGFLSIGGGTAIGRGLFEISKINGEELSTAEKTAEEIYEEIYTFVDALNHQM